MKRNGNRSRCTQLVRQQPVRNLKLQISGLVHVLLLTFLLLVGRFDIHRVEREARLSRNGEVSDTQGVHLLFSLTPGAALWRDNTNGGITNAARSLLCVSINNQLNLNSYFKHIMTSVEFLGGLLLYDTCHLPSVASLSIPKCIGWHRWVSCLPRSERNKVLPQLKQFQSSLNILSNAA